MSARPFVLALVAAAAASAVAAGSTTEAALAAACVASLLVGYFWRRVTPTMVAGVLLYPPMVAGLSRAVPATWGCLLSGLFIVAVCEMATFEYDLTAALASPTGVDSEARRLAVRLSRAHTARVAVFFGLAGGVVACSAVVSSYALYSPAVVGAAALLMTTMVIYATR